MGSLANRAGASGRAKVDELLGRAPRHYLIGRLLVHRASAVNR